VFESDHHLNPLNAELNPICYLLALLGAHHFLHVSRIRVNAVSRQILLTASLLLAHTSLWVCVQGTRSTVSNFEVAVKTVISKVGDATVEAASGERHGGYLNHSQFCCGDHFWIPMWGSPETRPVPLWWPFLDIELRST
jgi:hypothetical protein